MIKLINDKMRGKVFVSSNNVYEMIIGCDSIIVKDKFAHYFDDNYHPLEIDINLPGSEIYNEICKYSGETEWREIFSYNISNIIEQCKADGYNQHYLFRSETDKDISINEDMVNTCYYSLDFESSIIITSKSIIVNHGNETFEFDKSFYSEDSIDEMVSIIVDKTGNDIFKTLNDVIIDIRTLLTQCFE